MEYYLLLIDHSRITLQHEEDIEAMSNDVFQGYVCI